MFILISSILSNPISVQTLVQLVYPGSSLHRSFHLLYIEPIPSPILHSITWNTFPNEPFPTVFSNSKSSFVIFGDSFIGSRFTNSSVDRFLSSFSCLFSYRSFFISSFTFPFLLPMKWINPKSFCTVIPSHNNHEIPTNIKQPYSQEIRNFRTYATRAEAVAELLILTIIYKHLLLPSGRKLLGSLVVTSQTMNTTLHHNQTELGVTILSVTLQVLSDCNSLLDQEVHIFRKRRSKS